MGARQLEVKVHIKIARGLIAMLIPIILYRTIIFFYVMFFIGTDVLICHRHLK